MCIGDSRKNIVLSRREVIEAERADQRQRFLETVKEGDKVEGLSLIHIWRARLVVFRLLRERALIPPQKLSI